MGRQVFTAGEILTAANMNDLSDQSVMVFDDATARTTAIPTPVEGMVTYLSDEDEVQVFDGSAFKAVGPGKILQVVSTAKTNVFTTSSTSYQEITGLTATITPSSTSSKILVNTSVAYTSAGGSVGQSPFLSIFRDSTNLVVPDSPGSRIPAYSVMLRLVPTDMYSAPFTFLDSPATTSSVTYSAKMRTDGAAAFVNRSGGDSNNSAHPRGVSTITVMEVAG